MLIRFVVAMAAIGVAASPALAEIGRVKRVYGQVMVVRGAATLPATSGLPLLEKDVLATGPDGRVSVAFIDNTRFSVGPKSRIALAQFKFNETTHQGGRFDTVVQRGSLAAGRASSSRAVAISPRDASAIALQNASSALSGASANAA